MFYGLKNWREFSRLFFSIKRLGTHQLGIIKRKSNAWGGTMKYHQIAGVAGFMSIFFFLPSLAVKLWNWLIYAPWYRKGWLVYLFIGLLLIAWVRRRVGNWKMQSQPVERPDHPLYIAKQRLAAGELTVEEFRRIKQELLE